MKRRVKRRFNYLLLVSSILFVMFSISNVLFIINLIKFNDVENVIRVIACAILITINVLLCWYCFLIFKKKKANKGLVIVDIIILILTILFAILNYNFSLVYNVLDRVSSNYEIESLSLVTMSDNDVVSISEIEGDIGVISNESSFDFAKEIVVKNKDVHLIKYDDYSVLIKDLYNGKIEYAFLPENYVDTFSVDESYVNISTETRVVKNTSKKVEIASIDKDLNKPFSILLMGVDTLDSSYNADTLLLITFNPDTLSTTMLSIPRDTYTKISCTGGKHKINSSGWYSDKCVVATVSNLVGIDIDYYIKINFTGIVELVDKLGGIDVDVVYPFCEQNSKRQFGNNMIYVEEGFQHLNGEQALALSRNRHFWPGKCPSKYNEKGYYDNNLRNDITRGLNQQLVLKGILNKLGDIKKIDTIYDLFDVVSNNVSTNMDKKTMLSFYNIFKNIIISSEDTEAVNLLDIQRLSFEVYGTYINIGGLDLSMIIPHQNSINAVTKAMKINLGLIDKDVIKNISFDINKPYEEVTIGKGIYGGTSIRLLEDMTKKSYDTASKYCNDNGFNCEFKYIDITDGSYINNQIISQSIPANYDISLIGNKKIIFEVAKVVSSSKFDYASCTLEGFKDDDKCMIPNFTSKSIDEFYKWYKNFGYLEIEISTTSDGKEGIVISQSIYNKSIYDLKKSDDKLIITYVKKEDVDTEDKEEVTDTEDKDKEETIDN